MAPFGIVFGHQPPASFEKAGPHCATSEHAPSPHPAFTLYACFFGKSAGVEKVTAVSAPFENDEYGARAIAAFKNVENQLVTKYGAPQHYDFLNEGSIWSEPRDWMNSIQFNERTYSSIWLAGKHKIPPELSGVVLELINNGAGVTLSLAYEGKDWGLVLAEIAAEQANVL